MNYLDRLSEIPYLKYAFLSYLFLGLTDTVHHFHAATALGHSTAMHAAAIGMVLVPIAIVSVFLHLRYGLKAPIWVFLSIAILAIAIPGLYHGGWNHLLKVLAHIRIDSPSTELASLFPSQSPNIWFYEATGLLEFMFAVVCSYFVFMLITVRAERA